MSTATITQATTEWVVLDEHRQIVVIFRGSDAEAAARDWEARGYTVVTHEAR